jgi:GNAT superfamily N-acetyltransferase
MSMPHIKEESSSMLISIRKAVRKDAPTLVEFNAAMALETENKTLSRDLLVKGVNAVFEKSSRGFYLIAEAQGMIAGALLITTEWSDWRNGDFWWIQSVYVRPEMRKKGVFRALFNYVLRLAKNTAGVCGCRLYTDCGNTIAKSTYLSLGMTETRYRLFELEF